MGRTAKQGRNASNAGISYVEYLFHFELNLVVCWKQSVSIGLRRIFNVVEVRA
jgi:hypothetical protein